MCKPGFGATEGGGGHRLAVDHGESLGFQENTPTQRRGRTTHCTPIHREPIETSNNHRRAEPQRAIFNEEAPPVRQQLKLKWIAQRGKARHSVARLVSLETPSVRTRAGAEPKKAGVCVVVLWCGGCFEQRLSAFGCVDATALIASDGSLWMMDVCGQ